MAANVQWLTFLFVLVDVHETGSCEGGIVV